MILFTSKSQTQICEMLANWKWISDTTDLFINFLMNYFKYYL